MKIDFQNLNIAPTPNPKALPVERVRVSTAHDDQFKTPEIGFIRNSNLHPEAISRGWYRV